MNHYNHTNELKDFRSEMKKESLLIAGLGMLVIEGLVSRFEKPDLTKFDLVEVKDDDPDIIVCPICFSYHKNCILCCCHQAVCSNCVVKRLEDDNPKCFLCCKDLVKYQKLRL